MSHFQNVTFSTDIKPRAKVAKPPPSVALTDSHGRLRKAMDSSFFRRRHLQPFPRELLLREFHTATNTY
jgi:hypothetical protein